MSEPGDKAKRPYYLAEFCPKFGKVCHASKHKAKLHLKGLKSRGYKGGEVYPCVACGGWHVGRWQGGVKGK